MTTIENRALLRSGSGLHLRRNTTHTLGAGPLRRILRVGVCGTDLQIQRRVRPDQAAILGHEGIALRFDDDGTARCCEIFNPVDPHDQDVILGHSYDGILQDFIADTVPSRCVVPAWGSLPVDLGALVEPTATALYAWELMRPHLSPKASVAIFGGGCAALLMAILGEDLGYRIRLIHPRRDRLEFIADLGVLDSAEFADFTLPDSADGAVICLPREAAWQAIEQATWTLTAGGVLDLFGGVPTGPCHPALPHIPLAAVRRMNVCGKAQNPRHIDAITSSGKQLRITGHRGTSPAQLHAAQQHLIAAPARFGKLVTQVISLPEAASVIPAMARRDRGRGEYAKIVVDLVMQQRSRPVDLGTTVADQLQDQR
ncbi:hypothetical protein AB0E01_42515 [Nocardia vinacea]|uniref:hypothetical protein n=1 Tax=Nocardia vinacea TaxID=96468 RepID=UPI0033D19487